MSGQHRIKGLDGIRGISVFMVIIAHAMQTVPVFAANFKFFTYYLSSFGHLGVRIFFVMSGYLITMLLLKEREKNGKISIRDFYIRRALRLFPTFFLYILVILVLKWTIVPEIFTNYSLILFAVFYLWNYSHVFINSAETDNGNWFLGHFWSLSMEEQFYLIWPVAFVKFKRETLIKIVLIIMAVMPFIRVATFLFFPNSRTQIRSMLHTGGDAILIGCLCALIEQAPAFRAKYFKYFQNPGLVLSVAVYLFVIAPLLTWRFEAAYNLTVGITLTNISIIYLLYWTMNVPSKVADFLNNKLLSHLGIASYSVYVWQQLFLTDKNNFWINKFPQNIIVAISVGMISHFLTEKPFLNLKKRFKKF